MAQKDALANAYAAGAPYGGLASADPGGTGAASNELTGGSPAYARKPLNWTTASGTGQVTGSAAYDVAAGSTAAWTFVASSNVAGAATVRDTADVVDQVFASQGTYIVSYTYTQS